MTWYYITFFVLIIGILVESKSVHEDPTYSVLWKEYSTVCKKSGNEDKTEAAVEAAVNSSDCTNNLVRYSPNEYINGPDEFFRRLCKNVTQWKACYDIVESAMKPCLDKVYLYGATDDYLEQNINFYCNVDGKNVVEFLSSYSPGAAECYFKNVSKQIIECHGFEGNDEAKKFSDRERCAKFDEFISCHVKVLKDCVPNIGDAGEKRFRFMRNSTACRKVEN